MIPVPVEGPSGRVRGLCLEVHDLVLSKYVASRAKDHEFNRSAIRHGFVQHDVLRSRLDATELDPSFRQILRQRIDGDFDAVGGSRG